ncbi:hypothetical protein PR048_004065 [Dryococelus australis]|uniref:Uncharacterized protein n=1 Tax=Dryococelus australis TaxID=614101 RepID=A0ABQ9I4G8_9NEOP|nr:hypothetical protein PR048_004065 [Dryococelus australis]
MFPKKPVGLTYAEAEMLIRNHMQPTRNYIAERLMFDKCAQQSDKSISEFISALKGLSVHCDFGNTLLERLRDKLVNCVKSDRFHQKLLAEENLTYDCALKLATSFEHALAELAVFLQSSTSAAERHTPSPLAVHQPEGSTFQYAERRGCHHVQSTAIISRNIRRRSQCAFVVARKILQEQSASTAVICVIVVRRLVICRLFVKALVCNTLLIKIDK